MCSDCRGGVKGREVRTGPERKHHVIHLNGYGDKLL